MTGVDDFAEATRLEPAGQGRWNVTLREEWGLWSPAGGYISALALRAAGEMTHLPRPASMTCHFLRMGKYAPAELRVEKIKPGKRSELLRVELMQDGRALLICHVWGVQDGLSGIEHDDTILADLPDPEEVRTYEEQFPDDPIPPFFQRIEQRPIKAMPGAGDAPRDPELTGFYKFRPRSHADDAFVDAARILLLLDSYGWLAQYPAHPVDGASPWIAPNMDYHYRFHRPTQAADWLHMRVRADVATGGLMSTEGQIHDSAGQLLASGSSQLMCLPRPGAN